MDIFRFVIGNSWKEYDIIYFKYHITPFLTRIMYIYTYVCISTFILYGEDVANEQFASLNIVAKCLDNIWKWHRSTNILYSHRFSDPHPLFFLDFFLFQWAQHHITHHGDVEMTCCSIWFWLVCDVSNWLCKKNKKF